MKTLKDEVLAKVKALEAAQSLEKAIEERLDAEKALQALQAEKEEQEQRARRDIEGLQNLVASFEKQNAKLEGNLISQADTLPQRLRFIVTSRPVAPRLQSCSSKRARGDTIC